MSPALGGCRQRSLFAGRPDRNDDQCQRGPEGHKCFAIIWGEERAAKLRRQWVRHGVACQMSFVSCLMWENSLLMNARVGSLAPLWQTLPTGMQLLGCLFRASGTVAALL